MFFIANNNPFFKSTKIAIFVRYVMCETEYKGWDCALPLVRPPLIVATITIMHIPQLRKAPERRRDARLEIG